MTKIPPDDILEALYKLRIRESEKLRTVLELYNMEIHQKKAGPDYHRLKAMVKRSIEQEIRNKNFGARNGNYEGNDVVKNQGTKQRGQRILGDCWQWEARSALKETFVVSVKISINVQKRHSRIRLRVLSCNRMREMRREREVPVEEAPVEECLDGPARITSKELAPFHSVFYWHPPECLFYKTKSGCRFGDKCSYAHRQVDEQPGKKKVLSQPVVQFIENTTIGLRIQ